MTAFAENSRFGRSKQPERTSNSIPVDRLRSLIRLDPETGRPLSDIPRPPASRLHALVEDAAREAGVSIAVILGPRRQRPIVLARQSAMRLAFEEGFSSTQVGRAFNRDHTTVLYAAGVLKKSKK